jgi:transposase
MWKAAHALTLSKHDRELLDALVRSGQTPQRAMLRARIILGAAEGRANHRLAQELGISRPKVLRWRQRFAEVGVAGLLKDAPRPGRRKKLGSKKSEAIVNATLHTTPRDATHWSSRTMARAHGVSAATVQRIWRAHGLQPHRSERFKLSRDPEFVPKLRDVVGLYLNPPEKAMVFCVDEKSQIQALDRTAPVLPLRPGIPARQTHDYIRHGTTTLFAALNVLDGTVIGSCKTRHRHVEFIEFLAKLDRSTSRRLDLHLIVDNYRTHKHPRVVEWLAAHPRFTLHFIPTSSSWLNLVERWFGEITRKQIRRGTFRSVPALTKVIYAYLRETNKAPRPFIWTATAAKIMHKIKHCHEALDSAH